MLRAGAVGVFRADRAIHRRTDRLLRRRIFYGKGNRSDERKSGVQKIEMHENIREKNRRRSRAERADRLHRFFPCRGVAESGTFRKKHWRKHDRIRGSRYGEAVFVG